MAKEVLTAYSMCVLHTTLSTQTLIFFHFTKNKHVTHFHPDITRQDSNTFHKEKSRAHFLGETKTSLHLRFMSARKSCDGKDMQKHVINFHKAQVPSAMNYFFMIFVRLEQ